MYRRNAALCLGRNGGDEVSDLLLVNAPNFPAEYKSEALAGATFLNILGKEKELEWTFLSSISVSPQI